MKFKRLTAVLTAVATAFLMTTTASAESVAQVSVSPTSASYFLTSDDLDCFVLIDEDISVEDDGIVAITKLYVKEDGISVCSDSGSQTYYIEKTFSESAVGQKSEWVRMWSTGTFSWNKANDSVSVVVDYTQTGYKKIIGSARIVTPYKLTADVEKPFLAKKRAYISQTITMSNSDSGWGNHTYELWIAVNTEGKLTYKRPVTQMSIRKEV